MFPFITRSMSSALTPPIHINIPSFVHKHGLNPVNGEPENVLREIVWNLPQTFEVVTSRVDRPIVGVCRHLDKRNDVWKLNY
jgi:hypothetical protein